ncbi:hypothetical protein WMY93_000222 [Mugilogobius chulae]|uniref:Cytochrome P450 family 8 subfamily B member 1 n=1 Tax=Mugilogobius chulae TaxID=88201 RepID=A0AAW0QDP6_9GOBI
MGLLLPVLLALLACLFGGLYFLGVFRQRRPGEPPLDKGWIPWLGHVLEFRKDTLKFLQRMRQKHGDVFTIQLGGHYITFLQDPFSFGAFVKESREKLNFTDFAIQLVKRVFGYHAISSDHSILEATSQKHLKGYGLQIMTESMMKNLQNLMLHNLGSAANRKTWTEDGLFNYCYNIVFRAGYLALYGNATSETEGDKEKAINKDRAESDVLFKEFRKYDQLFPNLAYNVLPPSGRREASRLMDFFWNKLSLEKIRRQHWTFIFWLLLYIMKDPVALKALRKEVDKVLKESGQEVRPGGPPVDLTYEMLMKTPVLDSAVEETLRLVAAPLLTRSVLQDMTLNMADGRQFFIRKGDRMAVFPYIAVHIDPEIHPDPHTFKYDRFLTPEGTRKTDFYKGGKRVKYYTMPWGSGVSMCPGRFFATNELKQFIFLMLVYFDFELINPDEEIPQIDRRRWGFGTMQPDREVKFRYRLRY